MKNECEQTRQALPNYLNGHLFRTSRTRIERHLQSCVMCRSEYEALRRVEETRQILREINAPEGVVGRMREGVFAIGRLKKIVYRPLWIVGILVAAAAVYYYVITPRQLDLEIESIVQTEPTATLPAPAEAQPENTAPPATPAAAAPLPDPEPLVVTITPENDKTAVRRINDVLHASGQPPAMKFSDTVKEVSGSLTAPELLAFFNRIEPAAKARYSRKRLESFPTDRPVPFVLKLKAAPKAAETPAPRAAKPEPQPAEAEVPAPPAVTAPVPPAVQ